MTDLLSRLSAATGPSRELDAEIALASGWHQIKTRWENPYGQFAELPRYTESIDAAITLIPEDLSWELSNWRTPDGFKVHYADFHARRECQGKHLVPAIALVIACLKAKDGKP